MKTLIPKFLHLTPEEEREILRQFEAYVAEILAKPKNEAKVAQPAIEAKANPQIEN